ncbi:hypothetical protein ACLOJK_024078 [Asimina triloba]
MHGLDRPAIRGVSAHVRRAMTQYKCRKLELGFVPYKFDITNRLKLRQVKLALRIGGNELSIDAPFVASCFEEH